MPEFDLDPAPIAEALRFLDVTLEGVAANLALDEALLAEAEERGGPPALRLWELPRPAVVLGATGPLRLDADVPACEADGVPIARRSSGGGTVVIGPGALNAAVVLPIGLHPALRAVETAQAAVLGRWALAIRRAGAPVEVRGSGDLALGDRKCAGSAQRRTKHHVLIHSSILYNFPLNIIPLYLGPPRREPAYRAGRSHADFVTNLPLPREVLRSALVSAWAPGGREPAAGAVPTARVEELLASRLGDPAWVARF